MFIKTAHNRVIYDQETAWLKKIDSQTTICKLFFLFARAGIKPALAMPFPFGLRTGMVGVPFGLLTGTGPAPVLCQAEAFMPILASTTLTT